MKKDTVCYIIYKETKGKRAPPTSDKAPKKPHNFDKKSQEIATFLLQKAQKCGKMSKVALILKKPKGAGIMLISYNKLWKLLIDRKMSRAELRRKIKISPNTMTKLIRDKEVSLTVIGRICEALETDVGSIMEFVRDSKEKTVTVREHS